jgi:subfamily B ATP-binding cassette protein MsbA
VNAAAVARSVIWEQRRRLVLGLVLLFVDRAAGMVVPLAPKWLVDDVVGKHRAELLPWLAGAVVAAAIVQAICVFALTRVLGLSAERVVLRWRRRLMARITRLPIARLDDMQTGALASRVMDDANSLQNLVGWDLARWTSNVLTALFGFAALLWLDWRITLTALAFAAVPGAAFHLAHRRLVPIYVERSRLRSEVTGRLTQTLAGIRIVKAYGAERREELVFARGLHRWFRVLASGATKKSAMNALAVVIASSVIAIVVVLGGRAILDGRMTLGGFASYVAFALMFSAPLLDLPEIAARLGETLADIERMREIEALAREDDGDDARAPLESVVGDVAFEDVSFAYREGKPVLRAVSFEAKRGTTTAIVGPSGAGKSTMLSLLLALHRPTTGRVTIDGRDLATLKLREWRKHLAVVLQDEFLFDGTIAENIAFARPGATTEEVDAARRAARLGDLPLETIVGERGVKLSGGQKQRVAIARAILKDAPILVLDEATAHLDGESESAVQDALASLREGRTVFVIAHRLTTVLAADAILVVDGGRIVERGKHGELLARSGRYRALHDAQIERDAAE